MNDTSKIIRPARGLSGVLRLPGDKSISHRYAMLAGFAAGRSLISNFATGQDCASTLACVSALGASVSQGQDGRLQIEGCAGRFAVPDAPLDCGNSGSTMRMLSGLLAGQAGEFVMTGDASLSRRPMRRVAEPIGRMGARVQMEDGHAPLRIHGSSTLHGIDYTPPVASAQVKSAVLFAGLSAQGATVVREGVRTRDHGELALRSFGAELSRDMTSVTLDGPQALQAAELAVPGDISSAAFFLAAALLFPGSSLTLDGVGLNPTRSAILDVMVSLGLRVRVLSVEEQNHELIGTLHVEGPQKPLGAEIRGGVAAQLIDELPVLAAIAPFTRDGVRIRDARELRVKESDRLNLVARNLRAMGADFDEFPDGIDVPGGQRPHGACIDTGGDHRIAMAFSVAALAAEGDTEIVDAGCAAVSFPEFYELLDGTAER